MQIHFTSTKFMFDIYNSSHRLVHVDRKIVFSNIYGCFPCLLVLCEYLSPDQLANVPMQKTVAALSKAGVPSVASAGFPAAWRPDPVLRDPGQL